MSLILTRKEDESFVILDRQGRHVATITVDQIHRGNARLAINAPGLQVWREEILIEREKNEEC